MPLSAKEKTDFETKCKQIEADIRRNLSLSETLGSHSAIRDLLKNILGTIGIAIKADEIGLLDKIMALTKTISEYPETTFSGENRTYFNTLKSLSDLYTDAKREDPINLDFFRDFFEAVPVMTVPTAHEGGGAGGSAYKAMRAAPAGGGGAAAPAAAHPAAAGGGSGSGGGAAAAPAAADRAAIIESRLGEANASLADLESHSSYEHDKTMDLLGLLNELASKSLTPSNIGEVLKLTRGLAVKLKKFASYNNDAAADLRRLLNTLASKPLELSNIEKVLKLTGGLAAYLRSHPPTDFSGLHDAESLVRKIEATHNQLLKKLPTEKLQSAHHLEKYYASASGSDESPSGPSAMRR